MATPVGPPTQKVSDVIASFRPTKRFKSDSHVTSLDFDDSGELAIVARTDNTLQLYNTTQGKHAKELKSEKYGVHLARFTHHSSSIIYASTKVDDAIRYLSSHDNSYIRYYKGHTGPVTSICLSPANDTFLSCSADNTVRLWSLNSPNVQGMLKLHAPYLAAYDPSANVIAIASPPTQTILLYDVRNYDKPPFATFDLQGWEQQYAPGRRGDWTKLEFSFDGKSLLVSTTGNGHYVLDAFSGELRYLCLRKSGHTGRAAPGTLSPGAISGQGDACFSPDGQYIIGGSGDDGLLVWDVTPERTDEKVQRPMTDLPGPGKGCVVAYNHRNNLLVSADRDTYFWVPDPDAVP